MLHLHVNVLNMPIIRDRTTSGGRGAGGRTIGLLTRVRVFLRDPDICCKDTNVVYDFNCFEERC